MHQGTPRWFLLNIQPLSSYTVTALIVSPQGIPLVRDPRKPLPQYWKLPGGRGQLPETPEQCAIREIKAETGLSLTRGSLKEVIREARAGHSFHFFTAGIRSLTHLRHSGEEGEQIALFQASEILELPDFFHPHRMVAGSLLAEIARRR